MKKIILIALMAIALFADELIIYTSSKMITDKDMVAEVTDMFNRGDSESEHFIVVDVDPQDSITLIRVEEKEGK